MKKAPGTAPGAFLYIQEAFCLAWGVSGEWNDVKSDFISFIQI